MKSFKIDPKLTIPELVQFVLEKFNVESYKIDITEESDGRYLCTAHDIFIDQYDLEKFCRDELGIHLDVIDDLCEHHACGNGGAYVEDYITIELKYGQYEKLKSKYPHSILLEGDASEDYVNSEKEIEFYSELDAKFKIRFAVGADLDF